MAGRLTGLRKSVYSLDYWFITKDTSRKPDEEIHRARSQTKELLSSWSLGPGQWHMEASWFTNLETLKPHTIGVYVEAFSRRHDLLLTLFSIPLPSLENGRREAENSKLPTMACLPGDRPTWSHIIRIRDTTLCALMA